MTMWARGPRVYTVTSRDHGHVHVAVVRDIDRDTVGALVDNLTGELGGRPAPVFLCVDLADVTFLGVAGINALLAGQRQARRCRVTYQVINAAGIALYALRALRLETVLLTPRR
ncbi:STAS domain-containing protein [Actinoplanes sp. NPDC023801]|uniref:STAS domain-containing protein n=1 Tax=Actinoplanes sp. NPDC023801 TaxID=3154595 RepID=UPI003407BB7A